HDAVDRRGLRWRPDEAAKDNDADSTESDPRPRRARVTQIVGRDLQRIAAGKGCGRQVGQTVQRVIDVNDGAAERHGGVRGAVSLTGAVAVTEGEAQVAEPAGERQ